MTRRKSLCAVASAALLAGLAVVAQAQMPSPPATADVTLAGKTIDIKYARPSMRGRKIMGGLVPYGRVWRTGANEATMLTTPVDLTIGSTRVPAGKYTLWTLPGSDKWKLIVNKQTGQWGTNYDESQDFARIDMKKEQVASPVEQFLISWDKKGADSADLVLTWETTKVSVPVRVAAAH